MNFTKRQKSKKVTRRQDFAMILGVFKAVARAHTWSYVTADTAAESTKSTQKPTPKGVEMINLQEFIKGNNINQSFVSWCKKLGVSFDYIKVQGEQRAYKAKAMKRTELEKFIRKGKEQVAKYPRLNIEAEAGLVSLLRILERALKLERGEA